ncbi:MAG: DNA polymerase III subunit alpha [Patescibacteria group bacterium]
MADPTPTPKEPVPYKFTHLHVHTHYSLLNALPQIPDLVKKAKKLGMPALAITDNGNMYGTIEFYKACKKNEIKPIIGVDFYVALRTRHDKTSGIDNKRSRLVLLAKNQNGYKQLIALVTESHLSGFYYKPRLDKELISQYKDDVVCIAPSFSSAISLALKQHDKEKALEWLEFYKSVYGQENFFLEITHHPEISNHQELMKELRDLAKETNTQIMAAHDVYYLDPEDRAARNTLMSIQSGGDMSERSFDDSEEDFSFISPDQADEYFANMPEALENTKKITEMCNVDIHMSTWYFPDIEEVPGKTHDDVLRDLAYEGIEKRGMERSPELIKRLDYELEVIKNKGYAKYFRVVSDLLHFAHDNKILTTIRGSVAGSLVTYLTKITNVDPLSYKLPFERFLNPERPSAPDIDMDYADNRRDEVIAYARRKYGAEKVAQIGTFGTMAAKGAVRDVARAMGYPVATGDRISKLIPMGSQGFAMTIDRALEEEPELKKIYDAEPEVRDIIEMAKKIEGCARHISVHAAGVVIAPDALTNHVPIQFDPKGEGKLITQYDMHGVGEDGVGLLKFDFLGIRNLSILADAVIKVKEIENIDVDIENVPIADEKTFQMLARGETVGLFQLNGTGMTKFLKELKPSTIHDINAMVALYRPGPMEMIPTYIERKHNPQKIEFLDKRMKEYLDMSFGLLVYQDDVMLTAIHLAGYSWLEADKLRKAMGKKIPEVMQAEKGKLMDGLIKNGLPEAKAEELWKLIEPFAAYGFNKAHAASYGRVAYQTSYMKANFPAIYMSAVLTAESGDTEKVAEIITECKRMRIAVLPPDINESDTHFTVIKNHSEITSAKTGNKKMIDAIRFGLTTIKNFGEGIGDIIIAERKRGGPFPTLVDFLNRIKDRALNRKSLEALIKCGAMDKLGERGHMLANIDDLLKYNKESTATHDQDSLFGLMADTTTVPSLRMKDAPAATGPEMLVWEKELLGLYISGHPLDQHQAKMTRVEMNIKKTKEVLKDGMMAVVYGLLEEVKPINTKKGDKMAFLKLSDYSSSIEAVAFPRTLKEFESMLQQDNCIAIKGKFSLRNGTPSILVEKVKVL